MGFVNSCEVCEKLTNGFLLLLTLKIQSFLPPLMHALIDRIEACNGVPTRLAESIPRLSSCGSDFNTYGTVGYTLEQKCDVLLRVLV